MLNKPVFPLDLDEIKLIKSSLQLFASTNNIEDINSSNLLNARISSISVLKNFDSPKSKFNENDFVTIATALLFIRSLTKDTNSIPDTIKLNVSLDDFIDMIDDIIEKCESILNTAGMTLGL